MRKTLVSTAAFHIWFGIIALILAAAAQAADIGARDVVVGVYKVEGTGAVGSPQSTDKSHRAMFFDRRLVALLAADEKRAGTHDVGRLQFDPVFDAQAADISELNIGAAAMSGGAARVTVTFKNSGKRFKLAYELVREDGRWRISNIYSTNDQTPWDLVSVLQGKGG